MDWKGILDQFRWEWGEKRREWPREREGENAIAANIILKSLSSVKKHRSIVAISICLRYSHLPPLKHLPPPFSEWPHNRPSTCLEYVPTDGGLFFLLNSPIHSPIRQIRTDALFHPPIRARAHPAVCVFLLHRAVLSVSTVHRSFHSPPCSQLLSYIARPVWFLH